MVPPAATHSNLVNAGSWTIVLFFDDAQNHDEMRIFGDKLKDTYIQTPQNSAFVTQLVRFLDRSDVNCLAVGWVVLPGQFADLLGKVLVLISDEEFGSFVKGAIKDLHGPLIARRQSCPRFDADFD